MATTDPQVKLTEIKITNLQEKTHIYKKKKLEYSLRLLVKPKNEKENIYVCLV